VPLGRWRRKFAQYLAAYFEPLEAYYVALQPTRPDPEGIFTDPRNEWPAWTWEVRFHTPLSLYQVERWCVAVDTQRALDDQLVNLHPMDPQFAAVAGVLGRREPTPEDGIHCDTLQAWVRGQAGL